MDTDTIVGLFFMVAGSAFVIGSGIGYYTGYVAADKEAQEFKLAVMAQRLKEDVIYGRTKNVPFPERARNASHAIQ